MLRRSVIVFLTLFVLLVCASVLFIRSEKAAEVLCRQIETRVGGAIDGKVSIDHCELRIAEKEVALTGVRIDSHSMGLHATLDALVARFRRWQAVGDLSLEGLDIVRPSVVVDLSDERLEEGLEETGQWSCSIPGSISRVAGVRLIEGDLAVLLDEGRFVRVEGVSAEASRKGRRQDVSLAMARGVVGLEGRELPITDLRAEVELDPSTSTISVSRSSVSSKGLSLTVQGTLEDLCSPVLDVSVTLDSSLERLESLFHVPEGLRPLGGHLRLVARGEGSYRGFEASATAALMDASCARIALGDVEIEARADRRAVLLDRVSTEVFGGPLTATGRIDLERGLPTELEVSGSKLSLAELVVALQRPGSWVDLTFSPSGSLTGTLHPLSLSGPVRTPVDDFVLLERYTSLGPPEPGEALLAFSNASLEGGVSFDDKEIRVMGARVRHGESRLNVSGSFPLSDVVEMDLDARVERLVLDELGPIVGLDYGGSLSGSLSLRGVYESPRIDADVASERFVFEGLKAGDWTGRFRFADMVISLEGVAGRLGVTRYAMDRFALDLGARPEPELDLRVTVNEGLLEEVIDAFIDFDEVARDFVGVRGHVRGSVGVKGSLEELDVDFNATASGGYLFEQPFRRGRAMGRLVGMSRFEFDEVAFSVAEEDAIVLRGWAVVDGPLALSLSAREVPSLHLFFGEELPLRGLISGDLVIEGEWEHPVGKGVGLMIDSRLRDTPVPPARLRLALDGMRLHASGHMVEDRIVGSGWIDLEEEHAFHVDLEFDEPDLTHWFGDDESRLERLGDLAIAASGSARLGGLAPEPSTIEGRVTVDRLEATWALPVPPGGEAGQGRETASPPVIDLVASEPLDIRLAGGGLALRRLLLSGPDMELEASGVQTATGELDLAVRASSGLALLQKLVPGIDYVDGRIVLEAGVGGTMNDPVVVGSADLSEGELRVDGLPLSINGLGGSLSFSQSRIIVEGLSGALGSGLLTVEGEISLRRFRPERLHLLARLDEVRMRVPKELQTTVAGRLVLAGSPKDLTLAGDMEVLSGRWLGELEMDQILPSFRRRMVTISPEVERDPLLDLDVRISAPGTLRVDTRTATGRLAADLRVVGNDVSPGVLGTISINEGTARFRGNEYVVTRGVVELQDMHGIVPWFDVLAESEIREYRVTVHAHGSPDDPKIDISSDPPLAETDLVTLVTLGITAGDTDAFGDGLAAAAAADALFAMSGLDRHVREFIPENPIVRDPSVRLTSGYSVRTGQVSPRLAFESSLLVEDLRLRYSAPIGLPGQKTQAEYRITEVVSAQAEWDTEGRRTTTLGNLGLDLKLRWEMD